MVINQRTIQLVEHNPHWKEQFEAEAKLIKKVFGSEMVALYHIGSTAIPGIKAKPIIDILGEVKDIQEVPSFNIPMSRIGYQAKGEMGITGRQYFRKGKGILHTHHLHIFQTGHPEIRRHLAFVDFLKNHPSEAQAYGQLKEKLVQEFREKPEEYTSAKTNFIKAIDERASDGWKSGLIAEAYGNRISYVHAGSGPPVILIHGLGGSTLVWQRNIEALAQRYSIYAIDMPGHGYSDNPTLGYGLEAARKYIAGFMDAMNIQKASFVGNSAGGLAAISFTLNHPERVDNLVIVDGAGLGQELAGFLKVLSVPVVGEILARPSVGSMRALLRALIYDQTKVPVGLAEEMANVRRLPGRKLALLKYLRLGANARGQKRNVIQTPDLGKISVPTLVVWGRNDFLVPVAHAERTAKAIKGARLHIFDSCGHWPQLEKSDDFNNLLREFLG